MVWLIRKRPTYMGLRSRIWTSGWSDAGMPGFMKIGFWKTGYFVIVLHTDTDILTWAKIQDHRILGHFQEQPCNMSQFGRTWPTAVYLHEHHFWSQLRKAVCLFGSTLLQRLEGPWLTGHRASGFQGTPVWQWTWRLTPFNTTTECNLMGKMMINHLEVPYFSDKPKWQWELMRMDCILRKNDLILLGTYINSIHPFYGILKFLSFAGILNWGNSAVELSICALPIDLATCFTLKQTKP